MSKVRERARQLNARQEIFEISCRTGEGFAPWLSWIEEKVGEHKKLRAGKM